MKSFLKEKLAIGIKTVHRRNEIKVIHERLNIKLEGETCYKIKSFFKEKVQSKMVTIS